MILHETFSLALAEVATSGEGPSVRLSARQRVLRLRRELPVTSSGRAWVLEVEVEVPAIDPERLVEECEEFLVEGRDGSHIGVVERVERAGVAEAASALLVSAGWFGRRHLRVDVEAIEVLVPEEQRVIVDESRMHSVASEG